MTDPVLAVLLAAVIADPDDDGPRLAYADRLEETGADDARAEFIRVQCELAGCGLGWGGDVARRNAGLRRRERELLGRNPGWRVLPPGGSFGTVLHRGFIGQVSLSCAAWLRHGPALVRAAPLEEVRLTDKGPDLGEDNRWRWYAGRGDGNDGADTIPPPLFAHLLGPEVATEVLFGTRAHADAALSLACLAWARSVATPPPAPVN